MQQNCRETFHFFIIYWSKVIIGWNFAFPEHFDVGDEDEQHGGVDDHQQEDLEMAVKKNTHKY